MHLSKLASTTPDKQALVMADGSRSLTYAELDRRSLQVESLIRAAGVGPEDHVALVMDNRPEFLEVAWGAQRAGAYWTPVNWHLTEEEAAYVVSDCGARLLFAAEPTAELAARIVERTPAVATAYVAGGTAAGLTDYTDARDAAPADAPDDEREGTYSFKKKSGSCQNAGSSCISKPE